MKTVRSPWFVGDLERQFDWYLTNASIQIADRFFAAVEKTIAFLTEHPEAAPLCAFAHTALRGIRLLPVTGKFSRFLIFYRVTDHLIIERVLHGYRDLAHRLLEPPGADD